METKVSSGTEVMDWLLEGGYEKGVITTIYGPGGSGKSNLLILFIANSLKGQKVIFIDTEGNFSPTRLIQITDDYRKVLEKVTFLKPTNFKEQEDAISKLDGLIKKDIGAIVVDSLTMLYRIEMDDEDSKIVNKSLVSQLRTLLEIARKNDIPILITSQVYADFEEKDKVNVVGGSIVKNMSKCMIELRKSGVNKIAIVKKHRSIEEEKSIIFKIYDQGIREVIIEDKKNLLETDDKKEDDGFAKD